MVLNKDGSISLKCQTAETYNNGSKDKSEKNIFLPTEVVVLISIINSLNLGYEKEPKYHTLVNLEEAVKNLKIISPGDLKSWPPEENALSFEYFFLNKVPEIAAVSE